MFFLNIRHSSKQSRQSFCQKNIVWQTKTSFILGIKEKSLYFWKLKRLLFWKSARLQCPKDSLRTKALQTLFLQKTFSFFCIFLFSYQLYFIAWNLHPFIFVLKYCFYLKLCFAENRPNRKVKRQVHLSVFKNYFSYFLYFLVFL